MLGLPPIWREHDGAIVPKDKSRRFWIPCMVFAGRLGHTIIIRISIFSIQFISNYYFRHLNTKKLRHNSNWNFKIMFSKRFDQQSVSSWSPAAGTHTWPEAAPVVYQERNRTGLHGGHHARKCERCCGKDDDDDHSSNVRTSRTASCGERLGLENSSLLYSLFFSR